VSTEPGQLQIDHLDRQIKACENTMREAATGHPDVALLQTAPGIGSILGFTIATEIGDIARFPTAKHLVGYTGLCPRVHQSGESDWRGPLTRHGPRWLRWAYIEAAIWASRHNAYQHRHQRTVRRLGPQRGPKVARVDTARRLAHATWWMLTKHETFNPAGPTLPLAA
jgi:transposase